MVDCKRRNNAVWVEEEEDDSISTHFVVCNYNDIMEQDTANNMNVRNQLENIHYDKSTKTTDCALNMITENCDEKSSDDEVVINIKKENICNGNEYDGNLTG
eukprot:784565_1